MQDSSSVVLNHSDNSVARVGAADQEVNGPGVHGAQLIVNSVSLGGMRLPYEHQLKFIGPTLPPSMLLDKLADFLIPAVLAEFIPKDMMIPMSLQNVSFNGKRSWEAAFDFRKGLKINFTPKASAARKFIKLRRVAREFIFDTSDEEVQTHSVVFQGSLGTSCTRKKEGRSSRFQLWKQL